MTNTYSGYLRRDNFIFFGIDPVRFLYALEIGLSHVELPAVVATLSLEP